MAESLCVLDPHLPAICGLHIGLQPDGSVWAWWRLLQVTAVVDDDDIHRPLDVLLDALCDTIRALYHVVVDNNRRDTLRVVPAVRTGNAPFLLLWLQLASQSGKILAGPLSE